MLTAKSLTPTAFNYRRPPQSALNRASAILVCVPLLILLFADRFDVSASTDFHFALLGDRTGEAVPGVFEAVCREAALEKPAFFLTVGDTIQGGDDGTVNTQWQQIAALLSPYGRFSFYLTPGNHDVWSGQSAARYQAFAKHALHYSFDYGGAHFTILNNSQSEEMPAAEIAFLEADLSSHSNAPLKFVISHRPSWIFQVVMSNPNFPLHQLVKRYGVKYVIAGHLHQMLHLDLEGITYLSMASSGGHLRNDKSYEHGWFFGHTDVRVKSASADFKIEELSSPFGKARVTHPVDWGAAGLLNF